MKNKITDEQIIQSARRQRKAIDQRMDVEPWHHRRQNRGIAAAITIAASLISFIAGYGIHAGMSKEESQPLAQVNQAKDACFQGGSRIPNTLPYPSIISRANGLLHALR